MNKRSSKKGRPIICSKTADTVRQCKKDVLRRAGWDKGMVDHLKPGKKLSIWTRPVPAGGEFICTVVLKSVEVTAPHQLQNQPYGAYEMQRMGVLGMHYNDWVEQFMDGDWYRLTHRITWVYESAKKRSETIDDPLYWMEQFKNFLEHPEWNRNDHSEEWFKRADGANDKQDLAMEWKRDYMGRE